MCFFKAPSAPDPVALPPAPEPVEVKKQLAPVLGGLGGTSNKSKKGQTGVRRDLTTTSTTPLYGSGLNLPQ